MLMIHLWFKPTFHPIPINAKSIQNITQKWVLGINNGSDFIYAKMYLRGLYDPRTIKEYLNSLK